MTRCISGNQFNINRQQKLTVLKTIDPSVTKLAVTELLDAFWLMSFSSNSAHVSLTPVNNP